MKEQYIKQVKKGIVLSLSRKKRKEIIRDLNEIFTSALEHGETEQQVMERLGSPEDFVNNTLEQLGVNSAAPQGRRGMLSGAISLLAAVAAFSIFAVARCGKAPDNAIGGADAMTGIQVVGAFGIDVTEILLAIGVIAMTAAVVQIARVLHKGGE